MTHRLTTILIAASSLILSYGVLGAQVKCPEGKAFSGSCVNPALAASMRQTSIIYSQPKLSQTAFPVLPAGDLEYRYPHALIPNPLKPAPAFTAAP
jgi:hypothetical protein